MSLFKERQQTSKRIIALENKILALKQELANTETPVVVQQPKDDSELLELQELVKTLKAELKKVKSDLTRSKNKIVKLQDQIILLESNEDV